MPDDLILERAKYTPRVVFSAELGTLELSGRSLAEDSFSFYLPLKEWVLAYLKNPKATTEITIHLDYFSSATTKQLVDFLTLFEKTNELTEYTVFVNWGYDKQDEVMRTRGEEIASIINLPFTYRGH